MYKEIMKLCGALILTMAFVIAGLWSYLLFMMNCDRTAQARVVYEGRGYAVLHVYLDLDQRDRLILVPIDGHHDYTAPVNVWACKEMPTEEEARRRFNEIRDQIYPRLEEGRP